jgi:hypothetical protein
MTRGNYPAGSGVSYAKGGTGMSRAQCHAGDVYAGYRGDKRATAERGVSWSC